MKFLNRHNTKRACIALAGLAAAATATLAVLVAALPSPVPQLEAMRSATTVLDREGRVLRTFLGRSEERSIYVPLSRISPHVVRATIAVEDKRFRLHPGVDPVSLLRAVYDNLRCGRVVSGASTITMQLARLMEPKPRTLRSKAIEAFRALQLEWALSKDAILESYLNFAPYGGNLVGIEAAARRYFSKPAADLTLVEAALLAGLPQSPSRLRPDRWPGRARKRRDAVLREMLDAGDIGRRQFAALTAQPVRLAVGKPPFRAPHFSQLVLDRYGPGRTYRTTLDPLVQADCERLLRSHVAGLRNKGVANAAVVVIENATGALRAMAGSADFFDEANGGQVNAALAPRSPGSALKPFTYALAFARGLCTPDTILADVPCTFSGYSPSNFDRRFHGPVRASDALARSLNVPAVRLLHELGPAALERLLRECGVTTLRPSSDSGLALTLGACEVRLMELASAYATLARLGERRPLALLQGEHHGGTRCGPASLASASRPQTLPAAACYLVARALRRYAEPGRLPIALKTGTSYGRHDAWAVGFNPQWTVGVWVGNVDGRPARTLVGAIAAAPLVERIFVSLYAGRRGPWYRRPDTVGERRVCAVSGSPAGAACASTRMGLFIRGVSPTARCRVHQERKIDVETGAVLCDRSVAGRAYRVEVVESWPAPLAAWLAARGRLPAPLPHFTACPGGARPPAPRILAPQDGQTYASAGRTGASQLLLSASTPRPVSWFVDGELYRRASAAGQVFWSPTSGPHTITCVDTSGAGSSVRIVVE